MALIQHLPKVTWGEERVYSAYMLWSLMERHQDRNLQAGTDVVTTENPCLAIPDFFLFLSYTA